MRPDIAVPVFINKSPRLFLAATLFFSLGATAAAQSGGSTVSWEQWQKYGPPVWEGWAIAGDPGVIFTDGAFHMYCTAITTVDGGPEQQVVLAHQVSADGVNWQPATPVTPDNPESIALAPSVDGWDRAIETAFPLRVGNEIFLYYSGYETEDPVLPQYKIGLARSPGGYEFTREGNAPVLVPEAGTADADAMTSPSVVYFNDGLYMLYTGFCLQGDCGQAGPGIRLLGAVSYDGINWEKQVEPVMDGGDYGLPWVDFAAEASLTPGPDGLFYLFFSGFSGEEGEDVQIGVARSPHPFGPWEVNPEPIVSSSSPAGWEGTEVLAPHVIFDCDNNIARLWYHGVQADPVDWAVGYAEAPFPVMNINTDWQRSDADPLIVPLGDVGDGFTDLAVADPSVMYDEDDGLWKAWYSTTLAAGEDVSVMAIHYAESTDGIDWQVQDEPVLYASFEDPQAWDHTQTETPFVIKVPDAPADRRYFLYYSGGNKDQGELGGGPYYQIGLAFSPDGRSFTRLPAAESPYGEAGLVLRGEDLLINIPDMARGLAADPTLLLDPDGTLRLWSSSYAEDAAGNVLAFGISHASSTDGIHWVSSPDNPLPSLRRPGDIVSGQQPSVLWNPCLDEYEMWWTYDRDQDLARIPATYFQAFGYWHATSPDGINWTPEFNDEPDFRWDASYSTERWGLLTGVHVMLHNNEYRMYYSAWSDEAPSEQFLLPTKAGIVPGATVLNLAVKPADVVAGDINGDCRVDQADLGILLSCYEINNCGDLDNDGDTDQADLGILLANYNIQP